MTNSMQQMAVDMTQQSDQDQPRDIIDTGSAPTDGADHLEKTGADVAHPYLGLMGAEKAAEEGTKAKAGMPLPDGMSVAEPDAVEAALKSVHDPEIPVNIYDLGLIYRCEVADSGDVEIDMTLTAPACPVAGEMPQQVANAVAGVDGIGLVTVTLTWTPPWRPNMMSDDAKLALDFFE